MAAGRLAAGLGDSWDSDVAWSFRHSPYALGAAFVFLLCVGSAVFAPWVAPHNPFDLSQLDLTNSLRPPAWIDGGDPAFLLGTDDQGRDILSTILFGARISLAVGICAVLLSMALGVSLGLLAGYLGGKTDAFIMRVADVLLVVGLALALLPGAHESMAFYVLVLSIGVSGWVQYARTVRGSTFVEKNKEYVQAARLFGIHPLAIMARHVLPNVLGPVLVIATIHIATAIITEATLSFLGVGVPPTEPSLGTLIRIGNDFLFSGEWWVTLFPGIALVVMVLALNPRLRT